MFLWQVRSRVNVPMIVSAPTARDLRNYVDWAVRLTGMSADEVLVRTIDHALTQYFKTDKLWRRERDQAAANRDGKVP